MRKIALVLLTLMAPAAYAQQLAPQQQEPADSRSVQAFIDKASGPCQTKAAQACVDLGMQFAAANPKQGITVADLKLLRQRIGAWYQYHSQEMPARSRASFGLGLMLADGMTMERLHASFDTDHDGRVTQQELMSNVKMDKRPLGDVLADPKAVDRNALAQRLGLLPQLTAGLFQTPNSQLEAQKPGN